MPLSLPSLPLVCDSLPVLAMFVSQQGGNDKLPCCPDIGQPVIQFSGSFDKEAIRLSQVPMIPLCAFALFLDPGLAPLHNQFLQGSAVPVSATTKTLDASMSFEAH